MSFFISSSKIIDIKNIFSFRGQQLAQQMETANPDLIDSLRRQMGGNPNDPDPPQPN